MINRPESTKTLLLKIIHKESKKDGRKRKPLSLAYLKNELLALKGTPVLKHYLQKALKDLCEKQLLIKATPVTYKLNQAALLKLEKPKKVLKKKIPAVKKNVQKKKLVKKVSKKTGKDVKKVTKVSKTTKGVKKVVKAKL